MEPAILVVIIGAIAGAITPFFALVKKWFSRKESKEIILKIHGVEVILSTKDFADDEEISKAIEQLMSKSEEGPHEQSK